ncbi:MAG: GNAT family N-acetyltransferase [Solirubrobacteraceae bacterium]
MSETTGPTTQQLPVDVALRDGTTVRVRPMEFSAPAEHYGLAVITGTDGQIVGSGSYKVADDGRAHLAFDISERLRGRGVGTLLLGHLAQAAAQHGIDELLAFVPAENRRMLHVLRTSGFDVTETSQGQTIEVTVPTPMSERVLAAFEQRAHTSAVSAVQAFLAPRTVAVIGASERSGSVGAALTRNLLQDRFTGEIFPVHPSAQTIAGLPAYRSVLDIDAELDLAVLAVNASRAIEVARQCAVAGVRALLVISAGFAEVGAEGRVRQQTLLEICRGAGMRLIGPNCLGLLNNAANVRLNATFAERMPPPGHIALMSQSGGVGIALAEAATRLSLGISSLVSVGNKADISGNDLLEYWEQDDQTDVIALYLESFGNPRRFAQIARRVSERKPILAVKSGRTPAGSRAASSHTAALLTASDTTVDALFRQAGVIRVETLGELLDSAALLNSQPLPRGSRVAIVTNGGGPGIMAADGCQSAGLDVVELAGPLRERLAALVPEHASVANPIDMTAAASAATYREVIVELARADACDLVVVLFVPALNVTAEMVGQEIDRACRAAPELTIAYVSMEAPQTSGDDPAATGRIRRAARFTLPEDAVRALGRAADYTRWRAKPRGSVVEHAGVDGERAAEIIAASLAHGGEWLSVEDTFALLDCYGIPCVPTSVAHSVEQTVAMAQAIGGPVAVKALAPGLVHKSDSGGVLLGLDGASAVRAGAQLLTDRLDAAGFKLDGWIVQQMAPAGVELLVGVVHDPSFGPVIACGAGGVTAELMGDVTVRITPLTDADAHEMVRSLRTFPLLDGFRGATPCDVSAVEDILSRISTLALAHPEIAELDLNPVIVTPSGALASDARVRVQAAEPKAPFGALRKS